MNKRSHKLSKLSKPQMLIAILAFITVLAVFAFMVRPAHADEAIYHSNLRIYEGQHSDHVTLEFHKLPQNGIESDAKEIIELSKSITGGISDDYGKLKAIHDWVANNIYYDWDSFYGGGRSENFALTTLESKKGLCAGYSSLTIALLRAADIPAKYISGILIDDNQPHAWCEVFIDGRWVIIDVAANSLNRYENGVFHPKVPCKDEYFDISIKDVSDTHKYNEYSTVITNGMFKAITSITSVAIPKGFTHIGEMAFRDCVNLTNVILHEGVEIIGTGAFYNCVKLESIEVFSALSGIGDHAFSGCVNLSGITVPGRLDYIGNYAFQACEKMTEANFLAGVEHIGNNAFSGCRSLSNIEINGNVVKIGDYAFWDCQSLNEIILPDTISSLGENAFEGCINLTIYGESGSAAEKIAKLKNISFVETIVEFKPNLVPLSEYIFEDENEEEIEENDVPLTAHVLEEDMPFENAVAIPSPQKVFVNNKQVEFDAYNINGNNYFKLRDLAYILNGTNKQFEVGYDDKTKAVTMTSGKPYTKVGGEMALMKNKTNKTAIPSPSKIYIDGKEEKLAAYNIDGNNYFKLRSIGEKFDFGVEWDEKNNAIMINTSKKYVAP